MSYQDIIWWSQIIWRLLLLLFVFGLMYKVIKDWDWFKQILSEPDTGKASSSRITALAVTWVFCYSYMKTVLTTIATDGEKQIPDVPEHWVYIIGSMLAINHAGKFLVERMKGVTGNGKSTKPAES